MNILSSLSVFMPSGTKAAPVEPSEEPVVVTRVLAPKPVAPVAAKPAPAPAPREDDAAAAASFDGMTFVERLERPEKIPRHIDVLTAAAGDKPARVKVRNDDREILALIEVSKNHAALLWTGEPTHRSRVIDVTTRARRAGLSLKHYFIVTPGILRIIYGPSTDGGAETSEYRGSMDLLIEQILAEAVRERASDIHILARGRVAHIRFRVDGDLEDYDHIPRAQAEALARALYIKADSDSKQLQFDPLSPQDAAITVKGLDVDGTPVELKLRWGSLPAFPSGWDITIRIARLDEKRERFALESLGYTDAQARRIRRATMVSEGLILFCGTTGSGKSTTLALVVEGWIQHTDRRKCARSVEDPVERIIVDCSQHPASRDGSASDDDVNRILKAIMRNDPDLIFIGEIRDEVMARLTQRSVQTGHKVLATLHAKNGITAVERMTDLKVESSVLCDGETIELIVTQKLIRKVCPKCALPYAKVRASLDAEFCERLEKVMGAAITGVRFRGPGCAHCRHRGTSGRTLVAELLDPTAQLLDLLQEKNGLAARKYWRGGQDGSNPELHGRTMLDHAIEKIKAGELSPLDVEIELRPLDAQESQDAARAWYARRYDAYGDLKRVD